MIGVDEKKFRELEDRMNDGFRLEAAQRLTHRLARALTDEEVMRVRPLGHSFATLTLGELEQLLETIVLMNAALSVIQLTPETHDWLEHNDPKALEQINEAIVLREVATETLK